MKVHVSLDNQSMSEKPKKMYGSIKYRIAGRWIQIDVAELANLVGNQGHAMIPAKLVGGIRAEHCECVL